MRILKLLIEKSDHFTSNYEVKLYESDAKDERGNRRMPKIHGPVIETDVVNKNGRKYPKALMERCVAQYKQDRMQPGKVRSYGCLDHPKDGVEIDLQKWSHFVTELDWKDNYVFGTCQLVDTEYGRIAETILRNGLTPGISTRGVGALMEEYGQETDVVGEFQLIAFDLVADPSGGNCYMDAILESKRYVIDGGKILEVNNVEKAYNMMEQQL